MTTPTPHRKTRYGRRDAGSAATELTLFTPLLILVLLFVVAVGRLAHAHLLVTDAAHQAARAASTARDPATAATRARTTAAASLTDHGAACHHRKVATDTSDFRPGGTVTVRIDCTVPLADLSQLHLAGQQQITSKFAAPLDAYRGGP